MKIKPIWRSVALMACLLSDGVTNAYADSSSGKEASALSAEKLNKGSGMAGQRNRLQPQQISDCLEKKDSCKTSQSSAVLDANSGEAPMEKKVTDNPSLWSKVGAAAIQFIRVVK